MSVTCFDNEHKQEVSFQHNANLPYYIIDLIYSKYIKFANNCSKCDEDERHRLVYPPQRPKTSLRQSTRVLLRR